MLIIKQVYRLIICGMSESDRKMADPPNVSSPVVSIIRPRQKERKHYTEDAINDEEIEGKRMFSVEEKLMSDKFCNFYVKEMKGDEFTLRYVQEYGFEFPVVIKEKSGLGMRLPSKNFTVNDVRQCVGSRRMLDVMDVTTQKDIEMSMKDWVKYYENPARDKLLNVISLEFSHTKLENYVESPTVVRHIDWVDRVWPRHLKQSQTEATNIIEDMKYPKVQKYCLMSVKGCYTDFHIDFGGTSVWYHILHGSKVFWLIPPTEKNLLMYETWVLSGKQGDVFFGDTVEKCGRIQLDAGFTFFIPTGWIHAVYTPQDSLVFGGNFLHSFGIEKQLRIAQIEDSTHVPTKFRYPFYTEMLWYVLEQYVHCLMGRSHQYEEDEEESKPQAQIPMMGLKLKEVKREPREGRPCLAERPNGTLITPPESPRSPLNVENSSPEMNFLNNCQLPVTPAQSSPKLPAAKIPSAMIPFSKLVDPTSAREVSFFGHTFAVNPTQFPSHPDVVNAEGRIDATNVEAVRRILDGVARLHHPTLQTPQPPASSAFEVPQETVTAPCISLINQSQHQQQQQPQSTQPTLQHVHLTRLEINGLKAIVQWLTSLPNAKKCIPDLIKNHTNLLNDVKLLLELHQNDDAKLCLTGKPVLSWPDSPKVAKSPIILKIRPTKPRPSHSSGGKSKGSGSSKGNSNARRRRTRCKKCEACLRTDCGECHFCKDMRKFGGPGRMKQSCISRQCMAPVLPHTACCMVCGKDGWEKIDNTEEEVSSLMECSICWEIVHPDCMRGRNSVGGGGGSGVGSVQPTGSGSSGGVGGSSGGDGLMNEDLPNSWECPRCCGNGKGGQTKVRLKNNPRQVKGARHKPSDVLRSPLPGPAVLSTPSEDVLSPEGVTTSSDVGQATRTLLTKEMPNLVVPLLSLQDVDVLGRKRKPSDDSEMLFLKKKIKVEVNEQRTQTSLQENSPSVANTLCVLRRSPVKEEKPAKLDDRKKRRTDSPPPTCKKMDGEVHVRSCSQGRSGEDRPPLLHQLMQGNPEGQTAATTVRPRPQQRVLTTQNGSDAKHKELLKCEVKVEKCDADVMRRKRKVDSNPRLSAQTQSTTSPRLRKPLYVVRPASVVIEKLKLENVKGDNGNAALDRDAMMSVFFYLPRADLCACMRVCRSWSQWCLDPRLWQHIDLTRRKITASHLAGIVRRQPTSLVLGWTNISKKLLSWLLCRLPQLRRLDLTGCSGATISALRTCNAPLLRSLDVSMSENFTDALLRELLSSPPDSRPGLIESRTRLRNLTHLCMSGCDISDVALRYVTQHLRLLSHLDVNLCTKLTDAGISLLGAVGSVTRETLTHLNASGCNKLTDASLEHLKRCVSLADVDVRGCPDVSTAACKKLMAHSKTTLVVTKNQMLERR